MPLSASTRGLLGQLLTLALAAAALPACATVGYSEARNEDVPFKRRQEEVPHEHGAVAQASLEGSTLTITVARVCDVRDVATVHRTTYRDRVNATPWVDWFLGVGGVAAVATGLGVYADASQVYPHDSTSRDYNPVGPGDARLAGAALIAAGAALESVVLVDLARTGGEEQEKSVVDVPGDTVASDTRCERHPLAVAPVALEFRTDKPPIAVGRTDDGGKLVILLGDGLKHDAIEGAADRAFVLVDGEKAGTMPVAPLETAFEGAAWEHVDEAGCSNPQSVGACESVESFLREYPDGKHAPAAHRLLREAAPAIQRMRDDQAWAGVEPDACSRPKDLSQVEAACAVVQRYLDSFPNGQHADAARAALKKGAVPIAEQRRKVAQQAARERAKQKAEAARAAYKLRACVRSKCNAICSMRCPWSDSCRRGCFDLCVGSDQVGSMCGDSE
jgi:hypothetical protein